MPPSLIPFPTRAPLEDIASQKDAPKDDYRQDLAVRLICPNCRDELPNIVEEYASGDLICGTCGLVLGDRIIDLRSEWRTFANDEGGPDPSRVGGPTNSLLGDSGDFSTIVGGDDPNGLSKELQRAAQRANSAHNTALLANSQNGNDANGTSGTSTPAVPGRNLSSGYMEIESMCDHISLPRTVVDVAKQLFKRTDEERILRGKPMNAVVAACIFIACRQAGPGVARSFKEIYTLTGVPRKLLAQCFKVLRQHFVTGDHHSRTHINGTNGSMTNGGVISSTTSPGDEVTGNAAGAEDLMARFCNHLGIPVPLQSKAIDVARSIAKLGLLDGRSPMTLAGSAIYFTTYLFGRGKSARDISIVAGISEGTVKLGYRILMKHKNELVDQAWLESGAAKLERLPAS